MLGLNIVIDSPEKLALRFSTELLKISNEAISKRGFFSLAVPGGSVANIFFPEMARTPINWKKVHVFFTDERSVSPQDKDSNFGLAKKLFIDPAAIPEANVHRILGEISPQDAAKKYQEVLIATLGLPPKLDFILSGVGPDGHIASLFPNHPALKINDQYVTGIEDSPKPPASRVTLTLPMFHLARSLAFAAFGSTKQALVRGLLKHEKGELPIHQALVENTLATLFTDIIGC